MDEVRERIARSAARAGRRAEDVRLVAVTKSHSFEAIARLFELGQMDVGESRVQELKAKFRAFNPPPSEGTPSSPTVGRWHLIGHLQRNKAAFVLGVADLVHSLDSVRIIRELEKRAAEQIARQRVLLEINVSGDPAKTGAPTSDLPAMLDALAESPHLVAEGLMTIAPYDENPEKARPHFARLRELMASIGKPPHFHPIHLSMGMSGDYEVAVEEGATLVRIGTAILGERVST